MILELVQARGIKHGSTAECHSEAGASATPTPQVKSQSVTTHPYDSPPDLVQPAFVHFAFFGVAFGVGRGVAFLAVGADESRRPHCYRGGLRRR